MPGMRPSGYASTQKTLKRSLSQQALESLLIKYVGPLSYNKLQMIHPDTWQNTTLNTSLKTGCLTKVSGNMTENGNFKEQEIKRYKVQNHTGDKNRG